MSKTIVETTPPPRSIRVALRELGESRDILRNLVRRDFAVKHKNSVLGVVWSLLNPLLLVAMFSVIFYFFNFRASPGTTYPFAVFFFCGLAIWNLFAACVTASVGSVVGGAYLVKKVYFAREVLPLSVVLSAGITFVFEFAVLCLFLVGFQVWPGWTILLAPIFPLLAMLLAAGIGLFLSALTVYFRDMEHFVGVAIQVWFWATPVIYSLNLIAHKSKLAAKIWLMNPITPVVIGFRQVVLDHQLPSLGWTAYSLFAGLTLLVSGYWFFNRFERQFPELI